MQTATVKTRTAGPEQREICKQCSWWKWCQYLESLKAQQDSCIERDEPIWVPDDY